MTGTRIHTARALGLWLALGSFLFLQQLNAQTPPDVAPQQSLSAPPLVRDLEQASGLNKVGGDPGYVRIERHPARPAEPAGHGGDVVMAATSSEEVREPWSQLGKRHFSLFATRIRDNELADIEFNFRDLFHREPFAGFYVELDDTVNLKDGELRLYFAPALQNVTMKIELKDDRHPASPQFMAFRRFALSRGCRHVLRLRDRRCCDGLRPIGGWRRVELWPNWRALRYVIFVVEARHNEAINGTLRLERIEYVRDNGQVFHIPMKEGKVNGFEYLPIKLLRALQPSSQECVVADAAEADVNTGELSSDSDVQPASLAESDVKAADGSQENPPDLNQVQLLQDETITGIGQLATDANEDSLSPDVFTPGFTEPIVVPRRDDPSTVLFLSGTGYKICDTVWPCIGVNAFAFSREEPKRVDDLLITALDIDLVTDAQKRRATEKPVFTRGWGASVIYDRPGEAYIYSPRWRFTYEERETLHALETRFPNVPDILEDTFEAAVLCNTPYLDTGNRYRLTTEPTFQFIDRDTSGTDIGPPEDVYRGVLNVVLSDDPGQREYFFQGIYGQGFHERIDLDPSEQAVRGEYRQWWGPDRTTYSAIGVGYSEIVFRVKESTLPNDVFRQFDIFGLLISEIDPQGRLRGTVSVSFNRTDIDITSFPPGLGLLKRNAKIDFYRVEARLTNEIVPDVDVSAGIEHSVADRHDFDSLGIVGRIAAFNFGPWRAELGARQTFYYHINDSLATLFFDANFAR